MRSSSPLPRNASLRTLAVFVVALLLVSACGGSGGSSNQSGAYQIGLTSDLSSQFGFIGQGLRNGATAYFDALNAAGGINGHRVELTSLDDTNKAPQGVGNMTKLVTQTKVSAVIGFQSSAVAAAVAPLAAQYKTPMLASTVAAALVEPPQPYLFAATIHTANYAAAQMAMAKQLMTEKPPPGGVVRVASITSSASAALQQWSDSIKAIAGSYGWDLVAQEIVPQDGIDMSGGLTKIVGAKPDVLIMGIGADAWIIAGMKQLEGTTFPIVSYDSPAWATVKSLNSNRFYYVSALSYATDQATPQFVKDAKAANLDANGVYVIRGYYEALVIADALKRCGFPCSGAQMQAALDQTDVDTGGIIQGHAQYGPTNHQGVRSLAAYRWDASKDAPTVVATDLTPGTKA
jgi:branched-chain amino acid transport system substrate-binding protein